MTPEDCVRGCLNGYPVSNESAVALAIHNCHITLNCSELIKRLLHNKNFTVKNDSNIGDPKCIPLPGLTQSVIYLIALPTLVCIGLIGNFLTVHVFLRVRVRPAVRIVRLCVCSLLLCDIFVLLTSLYLFTFANLVPTLLVAAPYIYGVAHSARTGSVWMAMLITVDRWNAVRHPLRHATRHTLCWARVSICTVIICSILYNIPRFLDIDVVEITYCGLGRTIGVDGGSLRNTDAYQTGYLLVAHSVFMMVIPFVVIFSLNILIYCELKRACRNRDKMTWSQVSREHSTTVMLCFEAVVFMICNTLPLVLNVLESLFESFFSSDTYRDLSRCVIYVNNLLVVFNSSSNFFVFYIFGSKFRHLFKQCFGGRLPTLIESPGFGLSERASSYYNVRTNSRRSYGSSLVAKRSLSGLYGDSTAVVWIELAPMNVVTAYYCRRKSSKRVSTV